MSLQTQYKKFADKIALTRESEHYKSAREKDDLITPKVEAAFKNEGYEVHSKLLQGSLATHTGIIPLDGDYDIDRAVVITKSSSPDNPIEPKKVVKRVLSEHGFKAPKIKNPCVTANYENKPLHIDFPIYRVDSFGNYQLAVGKEFANEENRYWDAADPKGLVDWITSDTNHQSIFKLTSEERWQYYRLVRYIKRWRDFKYDSESQRKKIFSIALTVMFKQSFKPSIGDSGKADDHAALKATLKLILSSNYFISTGNSQYDIVVYLPVTPQRDIFNGKGKDVGTTLKNRLQKLLDALNEADGLDTLKKQCELLQKHFGDDFPVPDENNSQKSTARVTSKSPGLVGVSNGA